MGQTVYIEFPESKLDIEEKICARRPHFPNPKMVRNASDTSSAAETRDKKGSAAARTAMQERARAVGSVKLTKQVDNCNQRAPKCRAVLKQYKNPNSSGDEDDPDVIERPSISIQLCSSQGTSEDSGNSSSADNNTRVEGVSKTGKNKKCSNLKTAPPTVDGDNVVAFASPKNSRVLKKSHTTPIAEFAVRTPKSVTATSTVTTGTTPKSSKKTTSTLTEAPTTGATPKSSKKTMSMVTEAPTAGTTQKSSKKTTSTVTEAPTAGTTQKSSKKMTSTVTEAPTAGTTPKSSKKITSTVTEAPSAGPTQKSSNKTTSTVTAKETSRTSAQGYDTGAGCSGTAQRSGDDTGVKKKNPLKPGVQSGKRPTERPTPRNTWPVSDNTADETDHSSTNENRIESRPNLAQPGTTTATNDTLTASDDEEQDETQMPSDLDSDVETILDHGSGFLRRPDPKKNISLGYDVDDAVEQLINNLNNVERNESDAQGADTAVSDESSSSTVESIVRLKAENKLLRILNYRLQRNLSISHKQVEATLNNVNLETRSTVAERVREGADMAIGFRNSITEKIHAGYGYWIRTRDYDDLRTRSALTPYKFIANIAVMIFTEETMRKSSVSGKKCNAHPYKDGRRRAVKPALNVNGLDAVAAMTRFWMKSTTNPKYREDDILREISNIRTVIAKKICDMNQPSKARSATESETEASQPTPGDARSVNELQGSEDKSEEEGSVENVGEDELQDSEDKSEEEGSVENVGEDELQDSEDKSEEEGSVENVSKDDEEKGDPDVHVHLTSDDEDSNVGESSESGDDVKQPEEVPMDVSLDGSTVAEDGGLDGIPLPVRGKMPPEGFVGLNKDNETDSEQSKKSNLRPDSADEYPEEATRVSKRPKILDA